jgi:hypothetical protein
VADLSRLGILLVAALIPVAGSAQPLPANSHPVHLSDRDWVNAYCTFCHGKEKIPQPTAGLVLDEDAVDVSRPDANPAFWEKVLRKLRAATLRQQIWTALNIPLEDQTALVFRVVTT